jgi:transcription initiation factor TFIIIB Brf1 subunit/transcription initiation factor TFIIB
MKEELRGVIIKYNPCTVYARKGSPCPQYDKGRKCGKTVGTCQLPKYDLWYKKVQTENNGEFYPNRIKLFEKNGRFMFLFHADKKAIIGEAEIISYKKKNDDYYYKFNNFQNYNHHVQLELLIRDTRLPKLAKMGRWRMVYIDRETINTIRLFSKLTHEKRKKLDKSIAQILTNIETLPLHASVSKLELVINQLKQKHLKQGISEKILDQSIQIVSQAKIQGLLEGRSLNSTFYASLYLIYRKNETPRTIKEIATLGNLESKELNKYYRLLKRKLNLVIPRVRAEDLVQHYAREFPEKIIIKAVCFANLLEKRTSMQGKAPSSLAALSIYLACLDENYSIKQVEISELLDVSSLTIRNLYNEFRLSQIALST